MTKLKIALAGAALLIAGAGSASAATFSGDLYFTRWTPTPNTVSKITYTYNDATNAFSLSPETVIGTVQGADGIIFDTNGHLLVGGQGFDVVHMLNATTGALIDDGSTANGSDSYHLTLDPTGTRVYTSAFGGELEVLPLAANSVGNATEYNVIGSDPGLTQVAYAPTTGNWFYVNGLPNGGGNVGLIDMSNIGTATLTATTTRLYSSVASAHGLVYDSYTGLMTLFGAGFTGTFTQSGLNLKQGGQFNCDFDQGAVDGFGHALVAGCNSITFIDYSVSHDITAPNFVTIRGPFANIDDVAPLSGLGSQNPTVPEPTTLALLGSGLVGAAIRRRRQARRKA